MRINFAHIRERSSTGGSIDFAVFEARSNAGIDSANAEVLAKLTAKARMAGHKIDQSALAFNEHGRTKFYGTKNLVDHLSRSGVPRWTHWIED
jgi:protein-disulfide isomerase-like protein with CxxC motif